MIYCLTRSTVKYLNCFVHMPDGRKEGLTPWLFYGMVSLGIKQQTFLDPLNFTFILSPNPSQNLNFLIAPHNKA